MATCDPLNLVVLGHVDHGKSTVVGRLLAEAGALPEGRLEGLRQRCERAGKTFEYAFLLDALSDEQAQGITIEAARIHFRSPLRRYLLVDAPGHLDFLRNMVTGASHADAALLVLDAEEGVRENSRRHGYLASMIGVRDVLVLVNKMDLVGWSEARFAEVAEEYRAWLARLGVQPREVLPVSGRHGDNLAQPSPRLDWFTGPTLLEALDDLEPATHAGPRPFRMFVQDVYKFTRFGDARRIVVGSVDSGAAEAGDEIVFHPSGRRSRIRTLECPSASAGEAVGFTLDEQVYVARGELATRAQDPPPRVSRRLLASLFWLGREPFQAGREYTLKIGTASVPSTLVEVVRHLDASTLEVSEGARAVQRNCVAECILELRRPVAFDEGDLLPRTGRFVLVEGYRIAGGGTVRRALPAPEKTVLGPQDRAERYRQKPSVVVLHGGSPDRRRRVGQALEARLFADGRMVVLVEEGEALPAAVPLLLRAGLLLLVPSPAPLDLPGAVPIHVDEDAEAVLQDRGILW